MALVGREDDDAFADRDDAPDERPLVAPEDRLYFCAQGKDCRGYRAGALLFQRPRSAGLARDTCAACVGRINRAHVERTREAVRALKTAVATGRSNDERDAMATLVAMVGAHQADQTIGAIRQSLTEAPAKRERGAR